MTAPTRNTAVTGRNADVGEMGAKPDDRWVILTRGIKREYDMGGEIVRALRGVDLAIARNEYVAIMGPSGSGKSTFMNVIGCLDRPSQGSSYRLDGVEVSSMASNDLADLRNLKIGFIFQGFNLLQRTDAIGNVMLPMMYAGVPASERHDRCSSSSILAQSASVTPPASARVSRIVIDAARVDQRIVAQIRDQGVGIAPEMLHKVFDLFVQQPQTLGKSRGGLGLGLAIVRSLVQAHGGTVSVYSDGLGKGSVFTIELPAVDFIPAADGPLAPQSSSLRAPDGGQRILQRLVAQPRQGLLELVVGQLFPEALEVRRDQAAAELAVLLAHGVARGTANSGASMNGE